MEEKEAEGGDRDTKKPIEKDEYYAFAGNHSPHWADCPLCNAGREESGKEHYLCSRHRVLASVQDQLFASNDLASGWTHVLNPDKTVISHIRYNPTFWKRLNASEQELLIESARFTTDYFPWVTPDLWEWLVRAVRELNDEEEVSE